jgi:hypothetical protein
VALTRIKSVQDLHNYLYAAMQLEHATIPLYLTALYSIHPGSNTDAFHVIRVVAVEEMLHLTLAANLLNAVGGTPDLNKPDFVPRYPAYLPDGEADFQVDLQGFSRDTIEMFTKIERPARAPKEEHRLRPRRRREGHVLAAAPDDPEVCFYSIGEFYAEIGRGLEHLQDELGADQLFTGDRSRQATAEYYYSGGGEIIPVYDLDSAQAAIRLISEQGEGLGGGIYDEESELAHYYRFKQLAHEAYYQPGDNQDEPTGPPLEVDWDAVYPIKKNAHLEDYEDGSEAQAAALDFNRGYAEFLGLLTRAFTGSPGLLIEAVVEMFRIKERMCALFRHPLPGVEGTNAAPTFEMSAVAAEVGR